MGDYSNIKGELVQSLIELLNSKIQNYKETILSAKESRDSESKSSAGDKYETGRAMMHIEIDKNERLLASVLKQKNEISKILVDKQCAKVEFGTVVITNKGKYFISIALGKISVADQKIFAISLASPIGQTIQGLHKGDVVQFQGSELIIEDLF